MFCSGNAADLAAESKAVQTVEVEFGVPLESDAPGDGAAHPVVLRIGKGEGSGQRSSGHVGETVVVVRALPEEDVGKGLVPAEVAEDVACTGDLRVFKPGGVSAPGW